MRFARVAIAATLLAVATPAVAQGLCADRPGKATPACVVDPGAFQIETSLADWSRSDDGPTRDDDLLFGDTLLRWGVADNLELRGSLTAYEHDRTRAPGGVNIAKGFGDIGLSAKWRAIDGGDAGVSVALLPSVTLPVGDAAVSDGTWSADVTVPIDIPVSDKISFNLAPTLSAAADGDGDGRHFAYSGAAAVNYQLSDAVSIGGELWAERDQDPAGHETQASADLLLAWQPAKDWQLDLSGYAGLTQATPDVELIAGVTRRF
ncbi:transporter [Sphingomonas koreensis]|nr:transporter [Sphingomonas koreensis]